MSNWINIDSAAIKTGKTPVFLDNARAVATAHGDADPTIEMIADVTASIRAAVANGNSLDLDPTKIPNSLKGLALRMLTRKLKDYLEQPLSVDEQKQADRDTVYLNRIVDNKIRFEKPDTAAGSAEMQGSSGLEQATGYPVDTAATPPIMTRQTLKGL